MASCLSVQLASQSTVKTIRQKNNEAKHQTNSFQNSRFAEINEYGVHGEALAIATAGEGRVWAGVAET